MTVQCCKCKKIRVGDEWIEGEASDILAVSHTYCPACFLEARVEVSNAHASNSRLSHANLVRCYLADHVQTI